MIRAATRALPAALAASPLLLAFVPERFLPSAVAYLANDGQAAVAFVAGLVFGVGLILRGPEAFSLAQSGLAKRLQAVRGSTFVLILAVAGFALLLLVIPASRWNGDGYGGDEPKYLRLAESLLQDADLDVKSQSQEPWTAARFARNLRRLVRDTGDAVSSLFSETPVPTSHRWNLGNWTLQGRSGGEYYVQSPGLPLLLLPALVAREAFDLVTKPPTFLPMLTLALLWTFGLVQTVLLASEVSGSRLAGVVAGTASLLSAPLLVGGMHFYPESAAVALIPWLLRQALRSSTSLPAPLTTAIIGLGCGFLPWLHPKFLLTAATLLALGAWKEIERRRRTHLALLLATAGATVFALLLFDHHVTGLLSPDALYRRYGSAVYRGPAAFFSPMLLNGVITALFGARDGLFVMAPVLLAGALALGSGLRTGDRRLTLSLAAVFASLWIAAAVHEGGAPGPPGRLLAPVACVLAALVALGLVRLEASLGYFLTVTTLAALTLTITAAMFGDWRRTNNPYREMFATPERDFAKDLPDGPGRREAPYELHKSRDRLRGVVLFGLVGFWSWRLARVPQPDRQLGPDRVLSGWIAAFWTSLAVAALALWALGP